MSFSSIIKLNIIFKIIKNDQKKYLIEKKKLHISKNKIDEYIKKYYDESLQNYLDIFKTIQFLRQIYQFSHMRAKVEVYIKKCFNC